jgi:hypothetical protein
MSLTAEEMKQTSIELKKNMELSGLDFFDIKKDLGFDITTFESVINLSEVHDPTDVWRLRDYLEKKILEQGKKPYPYSKLKVNIWFNYD